MHAIGDEELEAVRRVFESKKLFRYQPNGGECDAFESEFAELLGTSKALLLTSGTNALIAALKACEIGSGDEVIIPAYTFVATAAAVLAVGAVPVVANIDETLGLSRSDVHRKLSAKTRAIIPVHMDGLACDLDSISDIARERGLALIEDAAQAIGGSYRGRRLGTIGDVGCFSLNENKNISCGEGGILVTKSPELYRRAFCIHDVSARFNPVNKPVYETVQPFLGASMRVSEISGAIMRVQLRRLDGILSGLRQRKGMIRENLGTLDSVEIIAGACDAGDCASSLHLLFSDPVSALSIGRELRCNRIPAFPVVMRPAHVCWKWGPLLPLPSANYLESVSILSRTLKLDVDLSWKIEDAAALGKKLRELIKSAETG